MCSGHALESSARGQEDGVYDAFVTKPYNLADLLETLATLLKLTLDYDARTEAPEAAAPPPEDRPIRLKDLQGLASSARIGHARGIADRLDELEQQEDPPLARIGELRRLLNDFRMVEIERKLSEWMEA